jgi:hypothetical protein
MGRDARKLMPDYRIESTINKRIIGVGGLPIEIHKNVGQEWVKLEDFQLILKFKNLQISHLERYIAENCPYKEVE